MIITFVGSVACTLVTVNLVFPHGVRFRLIHVDGILEHQMFNGSGGGS